MAIIIPSKKIYDIYNPKVVQNALKSIEFELTKAKPVEESEKTPLKTDIDLSNIVETTISEQYDRRIPTTTYGNGYMFSGGLKTQVEWAKATITLPKKNYKYYIAKINPKIEITFDVAISSVRAYSYIGAIPSGTKRFEFTSTVDTSRETIASNYYFGTTNIDYNNGLYYKFQKDISMLPNGIKCEFTTFSTNPNNSDDDKRASNFSLQNLPDTLNHEYPYKIDVNSNIEDFEITIDIAKNITVWVADDCDESQNQNIIASHPIQATMIELKAKSAQIVFNETKREVLTSIEQSICTNIDAIGDAVYSINTNPFIRAESKIDGVNNAPEILYNQTLMEYAKGKETALIRCSIGEYYNDVGEKKISTQNSDKMVFEIYDKVIPMVKKANGIDYPISTNSDGSAKIFNVIGVRVYYDGAVWQELTLKEFNESANIQIQLPAPTIRIAEDILYIQDSSGLGKSFQIYVDGNAQVITDSKTYPISNLSSITQGSHSIYVVSLGYGNYTSSVASNVVTYVKKVPLSAPVISIIDSTLVINDTSGKAEQFAVYANGALLLYTKASANTINLKSYISKEGTYTITVSAYADGYTASAMSEPVTYTVVEIPDVPDTVNNYLTFVGEDGEFTLTGSKYWDGQVYISTDATNWNLWNGSTQTSVDRKIYLRGTSNTTFRGSNAAISASLKLSGDATKVACYGNIANLLDYSKVATGKINEIEMAEKCFNYFFRETTDSKTRLTRCPELPFTTLSRYCYADMFSGCTQLSTLPKLPATTLQEYCYYRMFYNCSAIKLSGTQSDEYPNEYRIPTEGNISSGLSAARYDMFRGTGGSFAPTGNADILNRTLYTANEIV